MYSYKLSNLPKNAVEILVDIPKDTVQKEYEKAFNKLKLSLEIQGFRKGKAPDAVAKQHLKKENIYEEMIRGLLGVIYEEILKKENLKPLIQPKVELIKAKEAEDWQVKITLALKPLVELGSYKETIKKIKSETKKSEIWTPGKNKEKHNQELLNKILEGLLKTVKCEVSDLILEEEINRRLAGLLTEIQKIGLTVETYLKSKNLTQEQLRKQYSDEAVNTYKLEFILSEIADKEDVKVETADLEKLFEAIKDPKEKESAKANSYFYASILRKQKTLDYLMSL